MLETPIIDVGIGREIGYLTGLQNGYLGSLIFCARRVEKIRRETDRSGDDEKRAQAEAAWGCIIERLSADQVAEFSEFLKRYPKMPEWKLVTRILQESEYIYATYERDGED